MSGLTNLGTALTVIFVVSLLALFAELFFVLWRRRVFCRQIPAVHGGDHHPDNSTDSKELLFFFFCFKAQSRVEPSRPETGGSDESAPDDPTEVIDIFKLQEMYGPSRFLFTIKEEEREDLESEKSVSSVEKGRKKSRTIWSEEGSEVAGVSPGVAVTADADVEATPFSTPCASPTYFTPSASPTRKAEGKNCCSPPISATHDR